MTDDLMAGHEPAAADWFQRVEPGGEQQQVEAPAEATNGAAGRSVYATKRRTVYTVRDASGAIVAEHIRYEQTGRKKWFRWRIPPDGTERDGLDGMPESLVPLYNAHRLGDWRGAVVITEGEKKADALVAAGIPALGTVTGASGRPGQAALAELAGRPVILWPDADPVGRAHMERVAQGLEGIATSVRWVTWADALPGEDAADALARPDGLELVEELLAGAGPQPAPDPRTGAADAQARPSPERLADMTPPEDLDLFLIGAEGAEFIRPNVMAMIAGAYGSGKSQVRKEIEIKAATGEGSIFSYYPVRRAMTVLTIEEDNGPAEEFRRDEIHLSAYGLSRSQLTGAHRVSWPGLRLEVEESQSWLERLIDELRVELLILDPVGHMYAVKELREDLLPVYHFLRRLLHERPHLTILLIHHMRKLAQGASSERTLEDVRGGPWGGWVDVAAILSPMGDRRVRWTLHKRIAPSNLILEQTLGGPFSFITDAAQPPHKPRAVDRVLACVDAGAMAADEVMVATGLGRRAVYQAVHDLREQGVLEATGAYRRTPDAA